MHEEQQQKQLSDGGLRALAGIGGAGLVLTLGLSALWAVAAAEPPTRVGLNTAPVESAATVDTPAMLSPPAIALYDDEGGAHKVSPLPAPARPVSAANPRTATSLFDTH